MHGRHFGMIVLSSHLNNCQDHVCGEEGVTGLPIDNIGGDGGEGSNSCALAMFKLLCNFKTAPLAWIVHKS